MIYNTDKINRRDIESIVESINALPDMIDVMSRKRMMIRKDILAEWTDMTLLGESTTDDIVDMVDDIPHIKKLVESTVDETMDVYKSVMSAHESIMNNIATIKETAIDILDDCITEAHKLHNPAKISGIIYTSHDCNDYESLRLALSESYDSLVMKAQPVIFENTSSDSIGEVVENLRYVAESVCNVADVTVSLSIDHMAECMLDLREIESNINESTLSTEDIVNTITVNSHYLSESAIMSYSYMLGILESANTMYRNITGRDHMNIYVDGEKLTDVIRETTGVSIGLNEGETVPIQADSQDSLSNYSMDEVQSDWTSIGSVIENTRRDLDNIFVYLNWNNDIIIDDVTDICHILSVNSDFHTNNGSDVRNQDMDIIVSVSETDPGLPIIKDAIEDALNDSKLFYLKTSCVKDGRKLFAITMRNINIIE